MSYLYVCEQGSTVGIEDHRFLVRCKDGMVKSIPVETLEAMEIFGRVQLTTPCITECLKRGVQIVFYSASGAYFGRLVSTNHINVERQRVQAALTEEFCTEISRKILRAKIRNQVVILRRYARNSAYSVENSVDQMLRLSGKLDSCSQTEELMGYEGAAARVYFSALGELIDPDFHFTGRNRRPPMDPFNSLISLGYSVILNEIYGKLESKGLNPYFGIMHKDREKHPTLASDLMEEWRAVLADSLAMSVLNGHELNQEDFYRDPETGGVLLGKTGFKTFIGKLEHKLRTDNRYLNYIDYSVSFRRAMDLQMNQFCKAIENNDPDQYSPVIIR